MELIAPHGLLNDAYGRFVLGKIEPMEDFSGSAKTYEGIYKRILDDITRHIWPAWSYSQSEWVGDATQFAQEATKAELRLMIERFQKTPILDELPIGSKSVKEQDRETHLWHYRVEDGLALDHHRFSTLVSKSIGANYYLYNSSVDLRVFPKWFAENPRPKIHGLFDFKPHFQRPRPHQTALTFGFSDFDWKIARAGTHTGIHPSLMSGHCVQGILYGCKALEAWISSGASPSQDDLGSLAQYSADFGDRRVFAGVHYPSDNIASWIIALRLIPYLFEPKAEILAFALDAITNRSTVYKLVQSEFPLTAELLNSHAILKAVVEDARRQLTS